MSAPQPTGGFLQTVTGAFQPGEQVEAGRRGFAQGITADLAAPTIATIQAGVSGISETISNFINGKLEFGDFIGEYRQKLEEVQAADAEAKKNFPGTFTTAKVGGALALGVATLPASIPGAIAVGAGLSGLAAAGSSEADLTRGEVGEFAEDVLLGTAIGAVTGVAGQGISSALGAIGRAAGSTRAGQLIKDITANVIRPQAAAASIRKAAVANTKKTFDQTTNKNLVDGVAGLQKRGILHTERTKFQAADPRDMFKAVSKEADLLGESIEDAARFADEAGVDFGSNILGIKKLRETTKLLRKGSTSDEFKAAIDDVTNILENKETFKATDLLGLRKELDDLIEKGSKAGALTKSRKATLKQIRTQIKEALEDKIGSVTKQSTDIQDVFATNKVKNFAELNDAFGDTAVVREVLKDAAAITTKTEGEFFASPLSELFGEFTRVPGLIEVITRVGGRAAGAIIEPAIRGTGAAARAVGRIPGAKTAREAARIQNQSQVIARQIYQSIDEDNVINDQAERQLHSGKLLSNPTLSHAQKFREMNMLQTTGKINPESIPARDRRQVIKQIEEQNRLLEEQVRADILRGF